MHYSYIFATWSSGNSAHLYIGFEIPTSTLIKYNTATHNKKINKTTTNSVASVRPNEKELFKCLLPVFTDVSEQQGLDHTI